MIVNMVVDLKCQNDVVMSEHCRFILSKWCGFEPKLDCTIIMHLHTAIASLIIERSKHLSKQNEETSMAISTSGKCLSVCTSPVNLLRLLCLMYSFVPFRILQLGWIAREQMITASNASEGSSQHLCHLFPICQSQMLS